MESLKHLLTFGRGCLAKSGDGERKELSVHATPAGRFARDAPTPSKLAVLLFYLSCSFCVLGMILLVRGGFTKNVRRK